MLFETRIQILLKAAAVTVEHGNRLGGAHGVVVRLREQAHAVAEAELRGLRVEGPVNVGSAPAIGIPGVRAARSVLPRTMRDDINDSDAGVMAVDFASLFVARVLAHSPASLRPWGT